MIILVVNFFHQSRTILEADLVRSSHISGSGFAHAVEDFVEYIKTKRLLSENKGNYSITRYISRIFNILLAPIRLSMCCFHIE
jgi:hypothetical protein